MAQFPEEYGQYPTGDQQGHSGLNIENQASEVQQPWNPASGPSGPGGQTSWNTESAPATSLYSAPPVQPMYNDPQYQQGT